MFVETRDAMNVRSSGSRISIWSFFTFLRRIAIRVSRSGGWMSVIRPHSNRERRRSSSVEMSRGGRSRRHDDLAAGLVERVERVEELLLDPLLVLEELHVVDQQDVVGAVALLEPLDALVAQAVDEVVHECLRRHVAAREPAAVVGDEVRDRVQQVRLAEPRVAVDEERVVRLRGRLGDCERRSVREPVRRADHERVEGVLRVDADRHPCARRSPRSEAAALRSGQRLPWTGLYGSGSSRLFDHPKLNAQVCAARSPSRRRGSGRGNGPRSTRA